MTQFKALGRDDQTIRALDDAELDAVTGGVLNNCLPQQTIPVYTPITAKGFQDIFAMHGIGH